MKENTQWYNNLLSIKLNYSELVAVSHHGFLVACAFLLSLPVKDSVKDYAVNLSGQYCIISIYMYNKKQSL